jgi:TonB-linked SusC/RagA family outer membrane protein
MRKIIVLFMCAAIVTGQLSAQMRKISGKVTNANGAPVSNASVIVKGTTTGTTTDETGSFTLGVSSSAKTLVISSINYSETEVAITGDNLNVTMKPGSASLSEVVVVAYGQVKKTNVTGSVSTVKAADIENKPFSSVDKALQGEVAGLQSSSVSGAPGSATSIRIRGIGSITANANPLWVIDGVIANTTDLTVNTTTANPLSTINPDDIESISVLKDAAATAVYGSRGANGVILVATKKGKSGRTRLNFSTEIGQNSIAFSPSNKSLNSLQSQTLLRQSLINAGYAADNTEADALIIDPVNGLGINPNYTSINTNWLDLVTRKGNQSQYNLSMSGGTEKTQFYASAGFFKQDGTTIATDFKRYNGSLSLTHKANDKVTFTVGINGSSTNQTTPSNGGTFANPVLASFFLLPWYTPYNADGSFKYSDDPTSEFSTAGGIFNPLIQAAWNKSTSKQASFRGYITGEYKILDNLKFTSRYSAEYSDLQEDAYRNPFYGDGFAQGGDAFAAYTRVFDWTWSNFADFRKNLNAAKDIYFDVKAGYEAQKYNQYSLQAGGQNLPKVLSLQYLATAATPTTAFSLPSENATNSLFSTADINYKDRYVLSGSFRRDGSSVFGSNNRYGNFYSVGGTWNINEESFMKDLKLVNLLKIRSSYGEVGNANGFGFYTSQPLYGYGNNYAGLPGSATSNVGNPNLTWEKNKAFNVALDFGLLKNNRLTGTIEYYTRTSSGLLVFVPFSPTSGIGGQNTNVGDVVNKGIEVTLGGKPIVTKDFTWDASFNISHNENKVTDLYKGNPIAAGQFNYTVGHDLQTYYLRQWAGVDPANGDPLWYIDDSHKSTTNNISQAKLSLKYSAAPKVYGSFTNTFTYKGISLSAQLFYNFGNYLYDNWGSYTSSDGLYLGSFNQLTTELNAWQKAGDITNTPKNIFGGNKNSYRASTRFLYKDDYIRLRDVQLGYIIPQTLVKRAHINNLSIYVRGTNLFTFGTDKNLPFDPEAGINATANLEVFMPKTISAGIKIGL